MSNHLDKIRKELERRKKLEYPVNVQPYTNRNGSDSWQQISDKLISIPSTNEIITVASNSAGKTLYDAYLMLSLLYGKHPACKIWDTPIYVHVICESWDKLASTIQPKLAEITDFIITPRGVTTDPNLTIYRHSGIIKEIHHKLTNNYIKTSSAQEGAEGLVGITPHILIIDEPVSESVYNELVARNRTAFSKMLLTCTPISGKHAWIVYKAKELIVNPKANSYVLRSRAIDNPYFPEEKLQYWKETFGENSMEYRVRALGELEILEGLVMPSIRDCIVPDNYIPDEFHFHDYERNKAPYVWLEAADYGSYDGTLIIAAKLYDNGEIVVEAEWYKAKGAYANDTIEGYIDLRQKVGMPIVYDNSGVPKLYRNNNEIYRRPASSMGDGAELQKGDKKRGLDLRHILASHGIHVTRTPKITIEESLGVLNAIMASGKFKIKEGCVNLIDHALKHTYRYNETTGASTTKSPHDISMDVLRYLIMSPILQPFIQTYWAAQEYKFRPKTESEKRKEEYKKNVVLQRSLKNYGI